MSLRFLSLALGLGVSQLSAQLVPLSSFTFDIDGFNTDFTGNGSLVFYTNGEALLTLNNTGTLGQSTAGFLTGIYLYPPAGVGGSLILPTASTLADVRWSYQTDDLGQFNNLLKDYGRDEGDYRGWELTDKSKGYKGFGPGSTTEIRFTFNPAAIAASPELYPGIPEGWDLLLRVQSTGTNGEGSDKIGIIFEPLIIDPPPPVVVPEPSTVGFATLLTLLCLCFWRHRRR